MQLVIRQNDDHTSTAEKFVSSVSVCNTGQRSYIIKIIISPYNAFVHNRMYNTYTDRVGLLLISNGLKHATLIDAQIKVKYANDIHLQRGSRTVNCCRVNTFPPVAPRTHFAVTSR